MDCHIIACLEQTMASLTKTYSASNTSEIKEAEDRLRNLSNEFPKFIEVLQIIISQESNSGELRDAAIVYLKTYITNKMVYNCYEEKHMRYYHDVIVNLIFDIDLPEQIRNKLIIPLKELIRIDSTNQIKILMFPKIYNGLDKSKSYNELNATCMLIRCILETNERKEEIIDFFKEIPFFVPIEKILEELARGGSEEHSFKKIVIWAKTLKKFIDTIINLRKIKLNEFLAAKDIGEKISTSLKAILLLTPSENETSGNIEMDDIVPVKPLIRWTDCNSSWVMLNKSKKAALKTINNIFDWFISNGVMNTSPELKKFENNLHPYILLPLKISIDLAFRTSLENLQELLSNTSMEALIVEILDFFSVAVMYPKYSDFFYQNFKSLFCSILIPLIMTQQRELELIFYHPDEFVNIADNICFGQDSKLAKVASASFICKLCSHIDGALSYLANFLIEILNYGLMIVENDASKESLIKSVENSEFFKEFRDIIFLTETPAESQVETCFSVLAVVAYQVANRPDLINLLNKTLVNHFQHLFTKKNQVLIETRLLLFIQAYANCIFAELQYVSELTLMFEYIFVSIEVNLKCPENEVVVIQAINCILNIFEIQETGKRFSPELNKIIKYLKNITMMIPHTRFFEIFQMIVTKYKESLLDDTLLALLIDLLERVILEHTQNLQNFEKNRDSLIMTNLKLCCLICTERQIVGEFLFAKQKEILEPLILMLSRPDFIKYDDDILLLFEILMKSQRKVPQTFVDNFGCFCKVFEYKGLSFYSLFSIFNNILVLTHNVELQFCGFLKEFVDICLKCIVNNVYDPINRIQACYLIHIFLMKMSSFKKKPSGDNVDYSSLVIQILNSTLIALNGNVLNPTQAKLLENLIFSLWFHNRITLECLIQNEKLEFVFDLILKGADSIYLQEYDIKVFVVGWCTLLQTLPQEISQKLCIKVLQISFDLLFKAIIKNKQTESRSKDFMQEKTKRELIKKHEKSEILSDKAVNFDLDYEESQDSDDDNNKESDINNYSPDTCSQLRLIYRNLVHSIKQEDEFYAFRNFVSEIQTLLPVIYETFLNSLNEIQKNGLKEVLSYRKFSLGKEASKMEPKTVCRKIVKVKN